MLLAGPPAQPLPVEGVEDTRTVRVSTSDPDGLQDQRRLDAGTPGFATHLEIDLSHDATPADGVARLMSRAPGVHMRSLGGLGQFTAVQIRGSSAQQVPVFLDGVPIASGFAGLVDLSAQPLDGLDHVEIYRGHVPIRFGGAAIGGAVDLVGVEHRGPAMWNGSVGFGAFSTREARARVAWPLGDGSWSADVQLSYAGSEGDFAYFDNGGTPRRTDDDGRSRRDNNDYDRVLAQAVLTGRVARARIRQHAQVMWRERGIAGTAAAPATDTRGRSVVARSITRVQRDWPDRHDLELTWLLGLSGGVEWFTDPLGQVGTGVDDQRMDSFDGYGSPRLQIGLWPGATLGWVGSVRFEIADVDERDVPEEADVLASGDAIRHRFTASTGVELDQRLLGDVWSIVPAVGVDVVQSYFAVPEGDGDSLGDLGRDVADVGVSPRLATRIAFVPGAQLRGSGGRYFRPPTLFELFGDRGFVVGNEGLVPERGWSVDGGAVYDLQQPAWSLYAQVAGFATWSDDLIQFVRSGPAVRPINVEGARLRGVEVGASLRVWGRDVKLDGAYTFLDSRNESPETEQHGQPLPGRPRHQGNVTLDVGHAFGHGWLRFEPRLRYELEMVSETSLDPSNRFRLPPRQIHSLGVALHWSQGVHVVGEVRNLTDVISARIVPQAGPPDPVDVPVSDFIGYPLPGRSFFVRLAVDQEVFRSTH